MQAVILAAGKGLRMGEKTENFPKVLIKYKNKTLIGWKLDALPNQIDEVVIVIGHEGEKIKEFLGDKYDGKNIIYIEENEIRGTGYALWKTKGVLGENFLVMMGDDIYSKDSIEKAVLLPWSITVKKMRKENNSSRVLMDKTGKFLDFVTAEKYREIREGAGMAFTGLYSLKKEIFNYPLVKMTTKDEWGLPQTLAKIKDKIDLKIIETDFWIPISKPEDLV